ncbi:hypothetical protein D9615_007400 [Tricholomella constricta]|uniref:Uncharacterized protein n=1 Tax=Tricholomella constricta TaxID=117010 RepID=A0A8H5LXT6_9AGAR|nr:hypothetical protein D9615_007400 [Tricholomella constricta]
MARERPRHSKNTLKQRKARQANLKKVNNLQRNPLGEQTNTVQVQKLKRENGELKTKIKELTRKYWNTQRRNNRLEKVMTSQKLDLKKTKADAARLRGVVNMLGKELTELKDAADTSISLLQARIEALLEAQKDLTVRHIILKKRCRRLEAAKRQLKRQLHERAKTHPTTVRVVTG